MHCTISVANLKLHFNFKLINIIAPLLYIIGASTCILVKWPPVIYCGEAHAQLKT